VLSFLFFFLFVFFHVLFSLFCFSFLLYIPFCSLSCFHPFKMVEL
jgi:hypothetical protein